MLVIARLCSSSGPLLGRLTSIVRPSNIASRGSMVSNSNSRSIPITVGICLATLAILIEIGSAVLSAILVIGGSMGGYAMHGVMVFVYGNIIGCILGSLALVWAIGCQFFTVKMPGHNLNLVSIILAIISLLWPLYCFSSERRHTNEYGLRWPNTTSAGPNRFAVRSNCYPQPPSY